MIAESELLAYLQQALPAAVLRGTFDVVDFTDIDLTPVVGQVRLESMQWMDGVRGSAVTYDMGHTFSVYVDIPRATEADRAAAWQMLFTATRALCCWEFAAHQYPQMLDGLQTGFDGRVLRLSIGFSIPNHFSEASQ